jgi:hypothetical protein
VVLQAARLDDEKCYDSIASNDNICYNPSDLKMLQPSIEDVATSEMMRYNRRETTCYNQQDGCYNRQEKNAANDGTKCCKVD